MIARNRKGKTNTYHGGNHPTEPKTGSSGTPAAETWRRGKIAAEFLSDPRASASICGKVNRMQVLRAEVLVDTSARQKRQIASLGAD